MANDSLVYTVSINFVRQILERMPTNCRYRREADIQNDKLERMVVAFRKNFKFFETNDRVLSNAALRRKIGVAIHQLDRQSKIVRRLLNKTMEEKYFGDFSNPGTRKDFRIDLIESNREFDKRIFEATEEFRKSVLAAIAGHKQLPE